jgi:hypothetical protein
MAVGARSLREAMQTYTWVATLAVASLALMLWLGPCPGPSPAMVLLPADGPWSEATLDDGGQLWELRAGERLALYPGTYRVTFFAPDGRARRDDIVIGNMDLVLRSSDEESPRDSLDSSR